MAVSVLTIKNQLKTIIENANTVTSSYNISDGLKKKVQLISGANSQRKPTSNLDYPAIFVEVQSESDELYLMGKTSNRNVTINVDVVTVIQYMPDIETVDDETIRLVDNLQDLLRNNIKLSNTVDECIITGTDYSAEYVEDFYNSQSRMNLLIKKRG